MSNDEKSRLDATKNKVLTPAAKRALQEAKRRRAKQITKPLPKEKNGPKGAEPTRYGDWERGGITYDF